MNCLVQLGPDDRGYGWWRYNIRERQQEDDQRHVKNNRTDAGPQEPPGRNGLPPRGH
jgi:hypothetical protein